MYTLIDFVRRGIKCIKQLYHYMLKNSLWSIIHIKKSENLSWTVSKHSKETRHKTGKIRQWQHRFIRGCNETKQECLPQESIKHKQVLLQVC